MLVFKFILAYIRSEMKPVITGFFLLLCLLLLSGCSQSHAHAHFGAVHRSLTTPSETVTHHSNDTEQLETVFVINPASSEKKEVIKINVSEVREQEEDEDESSYRKYLKKANRFFAILCAHALRYSCTHSKRILAFYKHGPCIFLDRHLLIQIFRI